MTRCIVDANVVLRFLTAGPANQYRAAQALFERAHRGELELHLPAIIVAECVYVLEGVYRTARADIADALTKLLQAGGIAAPEGAVLIDALARYATTRIDFADCFVAAQARADRATVATFDADYKKFRDISLEPMGAGGKAAQ